MGAAALLAGRAWAQEAPLRPVAVLDAGVVLRGWRDYQEILSYVDYIRELDLRDLGEMRRKAMQMGEEAKANYEAGALGERDYEMQKAAIASRLRKLRSYWEIREEIINARLEEDEQKRLEMMQEAVNDLSLSRDYDIVVKSRAAAYYEPGFEVAGEITQAVERASSERAGSRAGEGSETAPRAAGEVGSASEP